MKTIGMVFLAALVGMASAYASEGKLIASVGEVSVVRAGQQLRLERGADVDAGDLIKVAAASSAQLRMNDQSIIALGQGTEFKIDSFKFNAEKPAEGNAFYSLVKGAFRTVTGLIGRHARDNYAVKAGSVATIGIRGTHYRLRLCDNDCASEGTSAPTNGLYGGVTEGRIGVSNDSGTEEFGADEYFFVANAAVRPERLMGPPDLLLDRASFLSKAKDNKGAPAAAAAPVVSSTIFAASPTVSGAFDALTNLSSQQFRPAEIAISPSQLAHVTPIDNFVDVGGAGTVHGQIVWMTNADIDLHLTLPDSGATVYYGNRLVSTAGYTAQLDHDNLGGTIDISPDRRVENITVTGSQIPVGAYTFYAHSFSGNNGGLPTTVQIRVTGDGNATSLADSVSLGDQQYSNNYIVNYRSSQPPTYAKQPR